MALSGHFPRASLVGSGLKPFSKSLALLLLAIAWVGSLSAPQFPVMARPHQQAAGCHEHGRKAPAPEPVSYSCCQAGHDSAILQASFTLQPGVLQVSPRVVFPERALAATLSNSQLTLFGDPPGTTRLRI